MSSTAEVLDAREAAMAAMLAIDLAVADAAGCDRAVRLAAQVKGCATAVEVAVAQRVAELHAARVRQTVGRPRYGHAHVTRAELDPERGAQLWAAIDAAPLPQRRCVRVEQPPTRRHRRSTPRHGLRRRHHPPPVDAARHVPHLCTAGLQASRSHHTTIHHIDPWDNGGTTDVDNMLPVRERHHHDLHEGHWQLTLDPDTRQLTITQPDRKVTITSRPP